MILVVVIYAIIVFILLITVYQNLCERKKISRIMTEHNILVSNNGKGIYTASSMGIYCNGLSEMSAIESLLELMGESIS